MYGSSTPEDGLSSPVSESGSEVRGPPEMYEVHGGEWENKTSRKLLFAEDEGPRFATMDELIRGVDWEAEGLDPPDDRVLLEGHPAKGKSGKASKGGRSGKGGKRRSQAESNGSGQQAQQDQIAEQQHRQQQVAQPEQGQQGELRGQGVHEQGHHPGMVMPEHKGNKHQAHQVQARLHQAQAQEQGHTKVGVEQQNVDDPMEVEEENEHKGNQKRPSSSALANEDEKDAALKMIDTAMKRVKAEQKVTAMKGRKRRTERQDAALKKKAKQEEEALTRLQEAAKKASHGEVDIMAGLEPADLLGEHALEAVPESDIDAGALPTGARNRFGTARSQDKRDKTVKKDDDKKDKKVLPGIGLKGGRFHKVDRQAKDPFADRQFAIPNAPFQRLTRDIIRGIEAEDPQNGKSTRIGVAAMIIFQEAVERYMVGVFEDCNACATHAKRVTIMPRDLLLTMRIRGELLRTQMALGDHRFGKDSVGILTRHQNVKEARQQTSGIGKHSQLQADHDLLSGRFDLGGGASVMGQYPMLEGPFAGAEGGRTGGFSVEMAFDQSGFEVGRQRGGASSSSSSSTLKGSKGAAKGMSSSAAAFKALAPVGIVKGGFEHAGGQSVSIYANEGDTTTAGGATTTAFTPGLTPHFMSRAMAGDHEPSAAEPYGNDAEMNDTGSSETPLNM
ncbi:unnamed protein product [Amoebophrya sp. A25]|nr:unnamed protein product [Amoebophrya sp. A25]|eukprot:GSA25T00012706001.1